MFGDLASRIIFMVIFGFVGLLMGSNLPQSWTIGYVSGPIMGALVGGAVGIATGPYLLFLPAHWLRSQISQASPQAMLWAAAGLLIGLFAAALLALPLSLLPDLYGKVLPAVFSLLLGLLGVLMATIVHQEMSHIGTALPSLGTTSRGTLQNGRRVVLDTSAIIDGRIADISQTGFLRETLVVPRFVLDELRHIADSPDAMRRNRGRRGLDILNKLQKESNVPVHISDADFEGTPEVDAKLVMLAKSLRCPIVTGDFNLNRVAELQGVSVLNVNELANAVKPVVLPGEELSVRIIQEGKEAGQGVGFLDDGTMIVVEGGRRHLNNLITVMVTRVLQTAAGRMIFAYPK
ncbi:MAG: PIN domain nuclease [Chloroflexi bacterium]|nr:PIN domain nuclease [Chloroflexota bacterium]